MTLQGDCRSCGGNQRIGVENALDYHEQIERLESELKERRATIAQMDKTYAENIHRYDVDQAKYQEEYARLKDRHDRLVDAFKTLQRVNHTLEDKLLNVVTEMTKRHEALEMKCQQLSLHLNAANARIAELTASGEGGGDYDDPESRGAYTPDVASRRAVPVSLGFGSGLVPLYHSSPDLCNMVNHKHRHTCPKQKQVHSPFAIQTFPPTLMCDTTMFAKRTHESDHAESEKTETDGRSRSSTGAFACGPCLVSQMPSSPPPMTSTLNEKTNDLTFDLKMHRPSGGSIFTV